MKLVVIGVGGHSRTSHGPSLKAYVTENPGEVDLAAVCDLNREKAKDYAKTFGFAATYDDFDEMIRKERPDGIIAVTPVNLTASLGKRLLRYEIPLLLEKPPGRNSAEAAGLLATAKDFDTPHMISFNRRFDPAFTRAQDWMAENRMQPLFALGRIVRSNRTEKDFVTATGVHLIDTLLSVMGCPKSVCRTRIHPEGGEPAIFSGEITFAAGRHATVIIAPDSARNEETIELYGAGWSVRIDMMNSCVEAYRDGELNMRWAAPADLARGTSDSSYCENKAFIDSILGRRPWSPTLEDGLICMQTAELIQEG